MKPAVKCGFSQALIVLLLTYVVAYISDKMVWTIPMLAASGFVASSIRKDIAERKVDDSAESGHHPEIEDG